MTNKQKLELLKMEAWFTALESQFRNRFEAVRRKIKELEG